MGKRWCCGLSLKKGSILVGLVEIVGFILAIILSSWVLYSSLDYSKSTGGDRDMGIVREKAGIDTGRREPPVFAPAQISPTVLVVLILAIILFTLGLVSAGILLIGVTKGSKTMMQTWMLGRILLVILLIIHLTMASRVFPILSWSNWEYNWGSQVKTNLRSHGGFYVDMVDIVLLCLSPYFLLVVYNHVKEKQKERINLTHNLLQQTDSFPTSQKTLYENIFSS